MPPIAQWAAQHPPERRVCYTWDHQPFTVDYNLALRMAMLNPPLRNRLSMGVASLGALAFILALTYWAGLPAPEHRPLFVVGVLVLAGSLFVFAWVYWHLLVRPLPAGHALPGQGALTVRTRQLLALLIAISAFSVVVGGFWDEVWHRVYGIPFGEDLLWRPHLMIYFGFLTISLLAFIGLYQLVKYGQGTLQQRFRANPVVGMMVLVGGFMLYAAPVDPLWHLLYGEDISAWSLPHLVLALAFGLMMLLASAIQLTTLPRRAWGFIWRIGSSEGLVLLALAFMQMVTLQILTTEWDVIQSTPAVREGIVWQRPDWLLPALLGLIAGFVGLLANHALRRVGSASVVGVMALGLRLALVVAFNVPGITANAWWCSLLPLLALDVWQGYQLRRQPAGPAGWVSSGVAVFVGLAATLPLLDRLFVHPQVHSSNLVAILAAGLAAAWAGAWVGHRLGDYLAEAHKQLEPTPTSDRRWQLLPPLAFLTVAAFIVIFIATAQPPA